MAKIISFEENIEKAKEVLDKLSASDVSLEDSIKHYKNGLKNLKDASKILDKAKLDFEELSNTNL